MNHRSFNPVLNPDFQKKKTEQGPKKTWDPKDQASPKRRHKKGGGYNGWGTPQKKKSGLKSKGTTDSLQKIRHQKGRRPKPIRGKSKSRQNVDFVILQNAGCFRIAKNLRPLIKRHTGGQWPPQGTVWARDHQGSKGPSVTRGRWERQRTPESPHGKETSNRHRPKIKRKSTLWTRKEATGGKSGRNYDPINNSTRNWEEMGSNLLKLGRTEKKLLGLEADVRERDTRGGTEKFLKRAVNEGFMAPCCDILSGFQKRGKVQGKKTIKGERKHLKQ